MKIKSLDEVLEELQHYREIYGNIPCLLISDSIEGDKAFVEPIAYTCVVGIDMDGESQDVVMLSTLSENETIEALSPEYDNEF